MRKETIPGFLAFKRKIANSLVFAKIYARTGGRLRFFVSAGAPLAKELGEALYALGLLAVEGYGLTETSPVITCNRPEDLKFGTVGKPVPGVEVRIAEDGEILARGPNIMKGYYKMEAATREAFEGDWFRTGDVGHVDEEGFLVITDRKKDILVTSGGKNVAPQPIENLLKSTTYIMNAVVLGDRRRFISALIVPDFDKLESYARKKGIAFQDRKELVRNEAILAFIQQEVDKAQVNLSRYEKIKKIIESLDQPVPQVLIKVLIAEITIGDTLDLGVEFSVLNMRDSGGMTIPSIINEPVFRGVNPVIGTTTYTANSLGIKN